MLAEPTLNEMPVQENSLPVVEAPARRKRAPAASPKVSEAQFVAVYNTSTASNLKEVASLLNINERLASVKACLARKKGLLTRNLSKTRNSSKTAVATGN